MHRREMRKFSGLLRRKSKRVTAGLSKTGNEDEILKFAVIPGAVPPEGGIPCLSAKRGAIGRRFFEPDDRFAGLGVAQFFAGQPFHCLGITVQGFNGSLQAAGGFLFLLDLSIELEDLGAHMLVLADLGKIPDDHKAEPGEEQKKDDRAGQLAPNPKINFHAMGVNSRLNRKERR